jgi:hypothetical protein
LDEGRAFEPQTRAVAYDRRGMMMADNLNAFRDLNCAMAVMKMKLVRLERVDHLDVAAQLSIVISGHDHDFTTARESA